MALVHGCLSQNGPDSNVALPNDRRPSLPNKQDEARRHYISKIKLQVKNWAERDVGRRRCDSLILWGTDEASSNG